MGIEYLCEPLTTALKRSHAGARTGPETPRESRPKRGISSRVGRKGKRLIVFMGGGRDGGGIAIMEAFGGKPFPPTRRTCQDRGLSVSCGQDMDHRKEI